MTTLYLIRHSMGFQPLEGEMKTNDSIQIRNEKSPLTIDGERLAEKIASNDEFKNLDVVWSSHYVRAMSTAKYFAINNNLKVNVDDRLGERIQGINSWDELPEGFGPRQFVDETYKFGFGENQLEVRKRMEEVIFEILNANKGKRICVVGHATATAFFLKRWCDINCKAPCSFNGKVFFSGIWNFCESFKLIFDDDNNLVSIENLKF